MNYSKRVVEIVDKLLKSSAYCSVSEIAEQLAISKRTIFREMDEVEHLVVELGMTLHKKTRLGVFLEASESQISVFRSLYNKTKEDFYSQQTRQDYIIVELLKNREPRKYYYFAAVLAVSEATISYDMDKIEPWFTSKGLHLVRKPGVGVFLEGDEASFRKATVDFLYQTGAQMDITNLLQRNTETMPLLDSLMDKAVLMKVSAILDGFNETLSKRLTDQAYMGLTIHLTIAVQRIIRGEKINIRQDVLKQLKEDIQFEIARSIGDKVAMAFMIQFPEDELGYITMHLKGSKLKSGGVVDQNDLILSNFEMTQLTARMISDFKRLSGFDLSEDDGLLIGLVTHLKPAITRLKLSLEIRNPLLDKIQEMYPEIYRFSALCAKRVEDQYSILMPPSEVGYLAMHFGAAIERFRKQSGSERRILTAVVCASGVGTSSLLYSRLSKMLPRLELVGQYSREDVMAGKMIADQIELIVSTIDIQQTATPLIKVNPLLTGEDIEQIKQVSAIIVNGPTTHSIETHKSLDQQGDQIVRLNGMTSAVLALKRQFRIIENYPTKSLQALIKQIADEEGSDYGGRRLIYKQLMEREKLGSTIIHGEGVILIHTKTKGVTTVSFSVRRLLRPLTNMNGASFQTAIVMLIPSDSHGSALELMSHLSKALLEETGLLEGLKSGPVDAVTDQFNGVMHQWLNRRIQKGGLV